MKITIEAEAKEIAALIVAIQERQISDDPKKIAETVTRRLDELHRKGAKE